MFRQINGLQMFVDECGSTNPRAMLFIHGFPFDHSLWHAQMQAVAVDFHGLAPDLRGHGGTYQIAADPAPAAMTIDLLADDMLALIDHVLPPDMKVDICGLSLGGYIAFALWRKMPERIAHLILADTKATADTAEIRARRMAQADQVLAHGAKAISAGMLDTLLSADLRDTTVAMAVRRMIESTSPAGIASTLHALADRPDSTSTLATITVPALIIVGEHDKLTPISDAQYMQERLPGKRPIAVIPGAGHVSCMEHPQAFSQHILDFLKTS